MTRQGQAIPTQATQYAGHRVEQPQQPTQTGKPKNKLNVRVIVPEGYKRTELNKPSPEELSKMEMYSQTWEDVIDFSKLESQKEQEIQQAIDNIPMPPVDPNNPYGNNAYDWYTTQVENIKNYYNAVYADKVNRYYELHYRPTPYNNTPYGNRVMYDVNAYGYMQPVHQINRAMNYGSNNDYLYGIGIREGKEENNKVIMNQQMANNPYYNNRPYTPFNPYINMQQPPNPYMQQNRQMPQVVPFYQNQGAPQYNTAYGYNQQQLAMQQQAQMQMNPYNAYVQQMQQQAYQQQLAQQRAIQQQAYQQQLAQQRAVEQSKTEPKEKKPVTIEYETPITQPVPEQTKQEFTKELEELDKFCPIGIMELQNADPVPMPEYDVTPNVGFQQPQQQSGKICNPYLNRYQPLMSRQPIQPKFLKETCVASKYANETVPEGPVVDVQYKKQPEYNGCMAPISVELLSQPVSQPEPQPAKKQPVNQNFANMTPIYPQYIQQPMVNQQYVQYQPNPYNQMNWQQPQYQYGYNQQPYYNQQQIVGFRNPEIANIVVANPQDAQQQVPVNQFGQPIPIYRNPEVAGIVTARSNNNNIIKICKGDEVLSTIGTTSGPLDDSFIRENMEMERMNRVYTPDPATTMSPDQARYDFSGKPYLENHFYGFTGKWHFPYRINLQSFPVDNFNNGDDSYKVKVFEQILAEQPPTEMFLRSAGEYLSYFDVPAGKIPVIYDRSFSEDHNDSFVIRPDGNHYILSDTDEIVKTCTDGVLDYIPYIANPYLEDSIVKLINRNLNGELTVTVEEHDESVREMINHRFAPVSNQLPQQNAGYWSSKIASGNVPKETIVERTPVTTYNGYMQNRYNPQYALQMQLRAIGQNPHYVIDPNNMMFPINHVSAPMACDNMREAAHSYYTEGYQSYNVVNSQYDLMAYCNNLQRTYMKVGQCARIAAGKEPYTEEQLQDIYGFKQPEQMKPQLTEDQVRAYNYLELCRIDDIKNLNIPVTPAAYAPYTATKEFRLAKAKQLYPDDMPMREFESKVSEEYRKMHTTEALPNRKRHGQMVYEVGASTKDLYSQYLAKLAKEDPRFKTEYSGQVQDRLLEIFKEMDPKVAENPILDPNFDWSNLGESPVTYSGVNEKTGNVKIDITMPYKKCSSPLHNPGPERLNDRVSEAFSAAYNEMARSRESQKEKIEKGIKQK